MAERACMVVVGGHVAGGMHSKGVCTAGGHAWHGACMAVGRGGVRGWKDGHCSGRYASYWNAFLFKFNMTLTANMEIAFRIYSV